jgi:hypothetical protein
MAIIDLKKLPPDIYTLIPMSIRLSVDTIELSELPPKVQYDIRKFTDRESNETPFFNDALDVNTNISVYNDLSPIRNKKDMVIEYLKNYFKIPLGSFPFDPLFGNDLQIHIQTKDTALRRLLISNELSKIVRTIETSFDVGVSVVDSQVYYSSVAGGTEANLQIKVEVEKEIVVFDVAGTG